MKLLIAEDDLTSQLMIKAMVAQAGYEPIVTGDGQSACEILLKPDAPKLAVLDWMMPGLDGVEVCRKVRKIKTLKNERKSPRVKRNTQSSPRHMKCSLLFLRQGFKINLEMRKCAGRKKLIGE